MPCKINDDGARRVLIEIVASVAGLDADEIRDEMKQEGKDPDAKLDELCHVLRRHLEPGAIRDAPSFASLRYDRFLRYWRAFASLNVVASIRETFGAVLFFAVFQTKFGSKPFTGKEIALLGGLSCGFLYVFAKWQAHLAKSGLDDHLVPWLPSSYFEAPGRPGRDSSEGITMAMREHALGRLRQRQRLMARLSLLFYGAWFLVVWVGFPTKIGQPWIAALCVAVVGFFFSRLYYYRLRYLDFVPLLSLEWGPEEEQGTLNDTTFVRVSQTDGNRAQLYRVTSDSATRLERIEVAVVRGLAHWLMWLAVSLRVAKRPTNIDGWKQAMGVRQVHDVWEFTSAVLIVFFFTIGAVTYSSNLDVWVAAFVMSGLVVSLYLERVVRATTHACRRDPGDVFARVTEESFGLITHDLAKLEYHSREGESDAKTRTLRYQGLFQRTVEMLMDHFETMRRLADTSSTPRKSTAEIADFTVLLLDLDNFRSCESIFGYSAADHVRFGLATVLRQAALRTGGIVGRPDDDGAVFCMILPKLGPELGGQVAEEIRIALKERIHMMRTNRMIVVRDEDEILARVDDVGQARFPNLTFARMVLATETSRASLESSKVTALRRLVDGGDGIVWPCTVSIGIASAADLGRSFREARLEPDYAKAFRALMQSAHYRLSLAKKKRDSVVGHGVPAEGHQS